MMSNPPNFRLKFDTVERQRYIGKRTHLETQGKPSNGHSHVTGFQILPENLKRRKKTIVLADQEHIMTEMVRECLWDNQAYEVVHLSDTDQVALLESVKPELIIVSVKGAGSTGKRLAKRMKTNAVISNIPLVLYSEEKPTVAELESMLLTGAFDWLNRSMHKMELTIAIRSALKHSDILSRIKEREAKILVEKEKLTNDFEMVQAEADVKCRESLAHLELLIHSKEVNEALLDKIHDLGPYLNPEGKSRLKSIVKQMKWTLNDEEQLLLERRLDVSNYEFYNRLEEKCPDLTQYEKRLCAYFRTNHSAVAIARIIRKSPNCINVAFARIRIKLGIRNNKELKSYLSNIYSEHINGPLLQLV